MGEVIAVMNQKGGCGKTTTVVNTATSLALMGKSVLVVDMDPQANATTSFGIDKTKLENTIYDAITGKISVKKAAIPTFIKNLFIIPSNMSLSGAGVELSEKENYHIILKNTLRGIVDLFDYIFIDLPPSLGVITVNALVASDSVLIPIQAEYYALEGVTQLLQTIRIVQKLYNRDLRIEGVLLTMFDARTNLSVEVQQEVIKHFKEKTYKTYIPRNIKLSEAPSSGESIFDYAISSEGAKAYVQLTREVIKNNEE